MRAADWRSCENPLVQHGWNALAELACEPNPFHESWYLLPALRALDPQNSVLLLQCKVGGDLAGLMPIKRENRYYGKPIPHLTTWLHPNSFLGTPLVSKGLERMFWRALFDWADVHTGRALFLHLPGLPMEGPMHSALIEVLAEQKRAHAVVHREERAMLASELSPEAYYEASISSKKRKELRRQFARLAEHGKVTFRRDNGCRQINRWIEAFLELEDYSWKGRIGSSLASSPQTAQMFRESLQAAAQRGKLERLTLELDGCPIAMLANFIQPPGAFSYKTAFSEAFARFSPGVLLQLENLSMLDRSDVAWTDSCASPDHPMIDRIWREKRAIGRYSIAIGGKLRRALFARLLKAELGRNPTGIGQ